VRGGVEITEEEGECTAFTVGPTLPQDWGLGAGEGGMEGMGLGSGAMHVWDTGTVPHNCKEGIPGPLCSPAR